MKCIKEGVLLKKTNRYCVIGRIVYCHHCGAEYEIEKNDEQYHACLTKDCGEKLFFIEPDLHCVNGNLMREAGLKTYLSNIFLIHDISLGYLTNISQTEFNKLPNSLGRLRTRSVNNTLGWMFELKLQPGMGSAEIKKWENENMRKYFPSMFPG